MTRYRKRPVIVEAVRFPMAEYADNPLALEEDPPEWFQKALAQEIIKPEFRSEDYWYLRIKTLKGEILASPGDFILCGIKGEIYSCKPDIFSLMYEKLGK
jgi:hypothetical protein